MLNDLYRDFVTGSTLKKVESETALLEKVSLLIPGFRGYKKKEMRREADRIIRDGIYRRLSGAKSNLREVFQMLAREKMADEMKVADKLIAKFDRVNEKIHHAPNGYAGFFDAVKIREDDLERMMDFDLKSAEAAKGIEAEVQGLRQEAQGGKYAKVKSRVGKISEMIEMLENSFDGRDEVVMGVEG